MVRAARSGRTATVMAFALAAIVVGASAAVPRRALQQVAADRRSGARTGGPVAELSVAERNTEDEPVVISAAAITEFATGAVIDVVGVSPAAGR